MLIKMHNKKLLKFIFIFNLFYTKYDQKLIYLTIGITRNYKNYLYS